MIDFFTTSPAECPRKIDLAARQGTTEHDRVPQNGLWKVGECVKFEVAPCCGERFAISQFPCREPV
jgi:hypothetical protein